MLDFLKWFIGIGATVCAVPLLLLLWGLSLAAVSGAIVKLNFTLLGGGLVGLLWALAGFYGLFGYWRWMNIQGKELEEKDIERLISIRKKGIWGLLAFLPIAPALAWLAIPLLCFVFYIFMDIKQKLDVLRG